MMNREIIQVDAPEAFFTEQDRKKLIFLYVLFFLSILIPIFFIPYIILVNLMKNDGSANYRQQARWLAFTANVGFIASVLFFMIAASFLFLEAFAVIFIAAFGIFLTFFWEIYRVTRSIYCYVMEKPLPS